MKLKKIASLALAGLMAVGMLAGCEASPASSTTPTTPIAEGTTEVSAEIGKRIAAPAYVTFADDSGLTADLKYAVQSADVADALAGYWTGALTQVTATSTSVPGTKVLPVLTSRVGVTTSKAVTIGTHTIKNIGQINTLKADEDGQSHSMTMPDAVAVNLYAVSSSIGADALNDQIASLIRSDILDYAYSVSQLNGTSGNNASSIFNHNYTVSVSTCSKTVNSSGALNNGTGVASADPTVVFVAVQVVRTSTHH